MGNGGLIRLRLTHGRQGLNHTLLKGIFLMAFAPDSSNYVLTAGDSALSHYHVLTGINGIVFTPGAAQGTATISSGGKLALLNSLSGTGFLKYDSGGNTLTTGTFTSTSSIAVTRGNGVGGSTTMAVIDGSSTQKINLLVDGDAVGSSTSLNFQASTGIGLVGEIDNPNNRINIIVSATGDGPGTVTSVAVTSSDLTVGGSPITSSGTITLALNTVAVSKGGTGFTTYAEGDLLYGSASNVLAKLTTSVTAHQVLSNDGGSGIPAWSGGTAASGNVLTYNGTNIVWAAPATHGTVTSVAVTSSDLTVGGSPITSTGTVTLALNTVVPTKGGTGLTTYAVGDLIYGSASNVLSKLTTSVTAHQLLSNDGASGIPTWVGGAASSGNVLTYNGTAIVWAAPTGSGTVTSVSVTSSDLTVGGSPITTSGTVTLALNTVVPTKGGTGLTTYTVGDLIYGSASNVLSNLATSGTAHQVLTNDGASSIPSWKGGTASSGNVLTYNGTNIVWAAPATAGTVTSIAVTNTGGQLTVTGSPITGSGTININMQHPYTPLITTGGAQTYGTALGVVGTTTVTTSAVFASTATILCTIVATTGTITTFPIVWINNIVSGAFDIHVALGGATNVTVAWLVVSGT